LRKRAKRNRKSIAGEVISLREEKVPTAQELKRRQRLFAQVLNLRAGKATNPGPFSIRKECSVRIGSVAV
jgi:hypothetical protein